MLVVVYFLRFRHFLPGSEFLLLALSLFDPFLHSVRELSRFIRFFFHPLFLLFFDFFNLSLFYFRLWLFYDGWLWRLYFGRPVKRQKETSLGIFGVVFFVVDDLPPAVTLDLYYLLFGLDCLLEVVLEALLLLLKSLLPFGFNRLPPLLENFLFLYCFFFFNF